MLSKKNRILATNYKQRWAIRKLTVGVVSVLLGGTMLFISGTTVSADNFIPKNESVSKVEKEVLNNNITEEKSINTSSEVITKETKGTDTTIDKTTLNVSEIDQQNNVVSSEIVPEKVQEIPTMSDASVELDNNTPTSEVEKVQSQPTVFSYQPKESDSRKNEDGDNVVTYFVIVREVTIVKPNGDEEILPYESMDTLYYEIESENDDLPLINFKAIDVPPIPGAKSPVIPGISQTVNSFMEDGIIDTSYVKPPVQRISSPEVTDLLEEEKYDELYDSYESKYKEYEKKFAKGDIQLNEYYDGLLIKEKYRYILDDDPKPIEGKEEKTITRTINVHLPNGEVQTTKQPVTLERKYTSVAGSDEKKYGPWTVGRWESFIAPEQEGYTAIPGAVDEVGVTSESLDAVVDIYYRADEPAIVEGKEEKTITRTINVHLPNGEVQTTKQPVTLERKYTSVAGSDEKKYGPWTVGRWESFIAPEQEGYTAIPGAVDEVGVTSESLDAVVDIYYRADEPAIVEGKEEKTITRTINVHLPNGEVQTTKQPVTLERKYTSVAGSDEKKYGPWTVGRWESFTAPEQESYTAIPGAVDEVGVTSESLDAVVDIYYRADEPAIVEGKEEKTITRTINVHLPNGEVQTTRQPVTLERKYTSVAGSDEKKYGPWTVGRWESFTAPEQEGYTAIPGAVDEIGVTSESLDAVVDIYYRADEPAIVEESEEVTDDPTPETSTTSPTPKNITNAKGKTATPELKNMDTKSKAFQNKLPQTGNKVGTIYSIIGLLLTSILGVWEIIRKR
ncbi:YSIRK-type signal peptide-containing protein [Ligilactobacillus salivarius]|uniref:Mucus-binding protein n=1 Tax=Ligilactobacillus salivarius TaxID=1624 RepID=A0ABD6XE54_9LACO|nr:YSIRK-type signal peptide-containing protein [Ligilactobacillus salivarius]ATP36911.1 mucus-binding protein [Ligilactobacillus salivarius]MDQ4443124.1 YSIRK-type signal peptide-containing protein [Ligilactobacillus salivarius]MDV9167158.1 YSIRK-type signal peptide-containing protein [Ligilactobacillus salivarius]PTR94609.1 mucus-binding protein [Ligilactobacillus salivarius]